MDADEYVETYVSDLETDCVYEGDRSVDSPQVLPVSTANAEYYLHPAAHFRETGIENVLLERVDGIVLEKASETYEEVGFDWFAEFDQYSNLVEQNLDTYQTPIYVVDVPTAEETVVDKYLPTDDELYKNIARLYAVDGVPLTVGAHGLIEGWLSAGEAVPLMMPAALLLFSSVAAKGHLKNTVSHLRVAGAYNPISGGRSAFTAKKLDEYLAPHVADEIGEKPHFLIEYGAAHLDIKPYLQYTRLRDGVTSLYQRLGTPWLQEEYSDKVLEFRFDGFLDGPTTTHGDSVYQKIIHEFEISD